MEANYGGEHASMPVNRNMQSTFSDLEDFYGTIILPPPARKPKGKPTVENHVRYLETHLVEKLKEKIHTSFDELNAEIKKIVATLNSRSFQKQAFSRQYAFEKYEARRMLHDLWLQSCHQSPQ